jgi:hypothetical protein
LPVFRSNSKAFEIAGDVKAFLTGKTSEWQEAKRVRNRIRSKKRTKRELKSKRQGFRRLKNELRTATGPGEIDELKQSEERIRQEILQLESKLLAGEEGQAESEKPGAGALPDFLIIGARKAGTTFLYNLLTRHPHVQRAARKELHYFNNLIEQEGIEWYRRCFPEPGWKDGRRTITGEATPYLAHLYAPERAAKMVPQARLIALLRNPVDRTYSDYQHEVRSGLESRTFEEAIEAEKARLLGEGGKTSEREGRAGANNSRYLSRGIYVDQLLRWWRFFDKEQTLVLKSEDFFENPQQTLKSVFGFLDLPDWEPGVLDLHNKRNKGKYRREIDPVTRRHLEEFFEPHNRRLYEHLGVDFGW